MRETEKKAMARRLRKKLTPAEALMWWRVVRFTNDEVERNRDGVRTTILMALEEQVERLRPKI